LELISPLNLLINQSTDEKKLLKINNMGEKETLFLLKPREHEDVHRQKKKSSAKKVARTMLYF
jgi:hypothetical protein